MNLFEELVIDRAKYALVFHNTLSLVVVTVRAVLAAYGSRNPAFLSLEFTNPLRLVDVVEYDAVVAKRHRR